MRTLVRSPRAYALGHSMPLCVRSRASPRAYTRGHEFSTKPFLPCLILYVVSTLPPTFTLVVTSSTAVCSSPPVRILTWMRVTLPSFCHFWCQGIVFFGVVFTTLHRFPLPTCHLGWPKPCTAHAIDEGVDCAVAPDETLDWDNASRGAHSEASS